MPLTTPFELVMKRYRLLSKYDQEKLRRVAGQMLWRKDIHDLNTLNVNNEIVEMFARGEWDLEYIPDRPPIELVI